MTPHFSDEELRCKCGCGQQNMRAGFMTKVEALRVAVGFPLPVTSAYRCPEHNARVSSTGLTGPHTTGRAIDLGVDRERAFHVLTVALRLGGFSGIGVQQKGAGRFIHLDSLTDGRPTIWSY